MEKVYEYYLDPKEMKYYLKPDHSGQGTAISIENGVIRENEKGEILLQKRCDNGCWAIIGGSMER